VSSSNINPFYHYYSFALRPGGPHHRNPARAGSGANKIQRLSLEAGAPAKAAYAVIGVFASDRRTRKKKTKHV